MTISRFRPPTSRPLKQHPPLSLCVRLAGQITAATMLLSCLPFVLLGLGIVLGQDLDHWVEAAKDFVAKLVIVNGFIVTALVLRESLK